VILEENHKDDFLKQYRPNLQFCRTHICFFNKEVFIIGDVGDRCVTYTGLILM